jgi:uncharacterized SAM-binding protein YcdF (DUF218 family)
LKKTFKVVAVIISGLALAVGTVALRIYSYRNVSPDVRADAAVVLGAAVWGTEVSPVLRERINHAVDLYRAGKVKKLIFTGGRGNSGEPTEAAAAREYAISRGVAAVDILLEEKSHTTYENILYAKEAADALEGALRPLVGGGLVERMSRHDTNPANNLAVPAEYRS